MTVSLTLTVLGVGLLFFRVHTLPERMAHKSKKLQVELVAVLGLLSLFTHEHAFWVAGLLLAFIDLPDFGTPLRRAVRALETMAHVASAEHREPPRVAQEPPPVSQPPPPLQAPTPSALEKQHA
jgi:hypothetical protein